jgi:hypothetical protein
MIKLQECAFKITQQADSWLITSTILSQTTNLYLTYFKNEYDVSLINDFSAGLGSTSQLLKPLISKISQHILKKRYYDLLQIVKS